MIECLEWSLSVARVFCTYVTC